MNRKPLTLNRLATPSVLGHCYFEDLHKVAIARLSGEQVRYLCTVAQDGEEFVAFCVETEHQARGATLHEAMDALRADLHQHHGGTKVVRLSKVSGNHRAAVAAARARA